MDYEKLHEGNIEKLIEDLGDDHVSVKAIYNMFRQEYEKNPQEIDFLPIKCYRATAKYFTNIRQQ